MELTVVAKALLRRWYVVLLGLLVTAGLVYVAQDKVPPTYDAAATVLLLPPQASLEGANPLLALGGLEQPADLVVATLASEAARSQFAEQHPTAEYDIVVDPLSRGPLIIVTTHDPSEAGAMAALATLLAEIPTTLDTLQDEVDAPQDSRLTSMHLTVDAQATKVNKDMLRAVIAALAVGLVLTLVAAVAFDSLANQRRAHRESAASRPSAEQPGEATSRRRERARAGRVRHSPRTELPGGAPLPESSESLADTLGSTPSPLETTSGQDDDADRMSDPLLGDSDLLQRR